MTKSKVLAEDTQAKIGNEYSEGASIVALARKYKVTKTTIIGTLARVGVPMRPSWNVRQRKLSPETIQQVKQMYAEGTSGHKIARALNCSAMDVYRALKREGVDPRAHQALSDEQEGELIAEFRVGEIVTTLSRKYSIDKATTRKIVRDAGIDLGGKRAKYRLNEHVFDNLDSEAAAYYLGFIYADGYVNKIANALVVNLAEKDICVVEAMQKFFETDTPVRIEPKISPPTGKVVQSCKLQITSEHLANRLKELGIAPRRPYFSRVLAHLPERQYRHFIRGYMDGDGSVSLPKWASIRFYGKEDTLSWFLKILGENGASKNVTVRPGQGISNIGFGGVQCVSIINYLYRDATLFLERKHTRAMALLEKYAE